MVKCCSDPAVPSTVIVYVPVGVPPTGVDMELFDCEPIPPQPVNQVKDRVSASIPASVQPYFGRLFSRKTPANGIQRVPSSAPVRMEFGKDSALLGAAVVIVNCDVTAFVPGVTALGRKEQLAFAGKPLQESVTAS